MQNEITREMILKGMALGLVVITDSPNGDGTVCKIGDNSLSNWFYFGGLTAEEENPFDYVMHTDVRDIVSEIMCVLDDFKTEEPDEYEFYSLVLQGK